MNFSNGNINGNLIANSLVGGGEAHNDLFGGTLPGSSVVTAVPEPSAIAGLGLGAIFLAALALGRRRRAGAAPRS